MDIFIQNLESGLFLDAASQWGPRERAYDFRTAAFAIDLCILRRLRKVRVIINSGNPETDISLEVRGAEQAALRGAMTRNEQLREQQRILTAQLDAVRAEQKESKRRFPFKRKSVAKADDPPATGDPGA